MIKKIFAVATLALGAVGAQAAITNLAVWDANAYIQSRGMNGIQFNTVNATQGTAFVALGAHPYTSGVTMPNNGVDTFYGPVGLATPTRANWSFDFAFNLGGCTDCQVQLRIDNPADVAAPFAFNINHPLTGVNTTDINAGGGTWLESWNLEMAHLAGFDFNAMAASITNFQLVILNATGGQVLSTNITVDVPEPGSLALAGLALAGLGFTAARRRKA